MIFVGGIHGVGKSSFTSILANKLGFRVIIASDIIKRFASTSLNKHVSNIENNQKIIIDYFLNKDQRLGNIILEGHFCLLSEDKKIVTISDNYFKSLSISKIIVMSASPVLIQKRLLKRDGIFWDLNLISEMQNFELKHARYVSTALNIELVELDEEQRCIEFFIGSLDNVES